MTMLTRKFIRGAGLALLGTAGALATSRSATADSPHTERAPTPEEADLLVEQHILDFEHGVPPTVTRVTDDLPIMATDEEPAQCFAHAARAMTKEFASMAIDPDQFSVAAKGALRNVEERGLDATQEERSALLWEFGEHLLELVEGVSEDA
ncbi:MAG: hypothetical protein ACE37F_25745 [Nannocystaceae bacterium]|nr:hypothetical protein [bacterium]